MRCKSPPCRHNTLYCRTPSPRGKGAGKKGAPVSGPLRRGGRIGRVPILSVFRPGRFRKEDRTAEGAAGSAGADQDGGSGRGGGGEQVGEGLRSRQDPAGPAPAWTAAPRMNPVRRKAMDRFEGGPDGRESPVGRRGADEENGKGPGGGGERVGEGLRSRQDPVLPAPRRRVSPWTYPVRRRRAKGRTRKRPHPLKVSAEVRHPEERARILQERCLDESPGAWPEGT